MEKIKPSGFQKGYSIKKSVSVDQRLKSSYKAGDTDSSDLYQYPNGMAGFIIILLAYIIFTIVVLVVGSNIDLVTFKVQWQNSVLGGGIGYLGINLLWVIGRTGLFNLSGYAFNKVGRVIHFDQIKEKVAKFTTTSAIRDVNNVAEYKSYCEVRKTYTKKWCYISLITSVVVAVASVVVYLIALYV